MRKRELITLALALVFCAPLVFGFGGPAPEEPQTPPQEQENQGGGGQALYPALMDNFEDGNITKDPTWWTFDKVILKVDKAAKLTGGDPVVEEESGEYALKIGGTATNWYVGGFGAYIAKDTAGYSAVTVDVWGSGKNSGKMKIELYDDDNGNYQIEQDKNFQPTFDDRFVYEFDINWSGWKRIKIPFKNFKDDNPGVGNSKLDAEAANGSGGLLQIQFIIVASSQTGSVNMALDNIELTN